MEDPTFINYLRIGYVSAQVISLGIYYLITVFVSETLSRSEKSRL